MADKKRRKKAEPSDEASAYDEERFRVLNENDNQEHRKIDAILFPEVNIDALELADIIDIEKIQKLMDQLYKVTKIGIGIIDIHGKVLIGTGWQEICTKFHRVNPETCRLCRESDFEFSRDVLVGKFKQYRCKNNMWDIASPIKLGDKHLGNIFLGPFLFDDETVDYESFRQQAALYGFNEQEYMAALENVHRWNRKTVEATMSFYSAFAELFSNLGYANVKLASALQDHKRAEEALHAASLYARRLIEVSLEPLVTISHDGKITDVNVATENVTGYKREELIGTDFSDYFTEPEKAREGYQQVFRQGSVHDYPLEIRGRDGHITYVLYNATVYKNEKGNVVGVFAAAHDITERRKAEETLRQSERRFRDVVTNLDEAYYSCTMDGVLLSHNPAFNRMLGYDLSKDLRGGHLPDFWQNRDDRAAYINELHANGKVVNYTINAKNSSGGLLVALANAHIVSDDMGTPLRIEGTFTDYTEMKRMEDSIEESESKFRQLAENINIVFWLTDWKEKKLLYVNPAYEVIFDMDIESAYADRLGWKKVVHPDDLARVNFEFQSHASSGKYLELDYRIFCRGQVKWIHERAFPVKDAAGNIEQYINVAEDITQRRIHEIEIENLNSFLLAIRNLNQAIVRISDFDQLLYESCRILHEIRGYLDVSIAFRDVTADCIIPKAHCGEHPPKQGGYPNECGNEHTPCIRKAMSQRSALLLEPGNDFCKDCDFCPHKASHQTIVVPMLDTDEIPVGVITACLELGRAIHKDEIPLFEEIAGDLVYAYRKTCAEQSLSASEKQFHGLFNAMAQGVVFQDVDGIITSTNPAAERILGLSLEQIQGRSSMDPRWRAIHEDGSDFPGDTHPVIEALKTGKEVRNVIMGIFNPEKNAYSWISVNAVPEFRPGGDKPFKVFTTFEDITDRRRLEEELKKHNENLRETAEAISKELTEAHQSLIKQERLAVLGQMAASVSHELRNPLSVINNVSYFLKMKYPDLDEQTLKMLNLLEKEVDRSDRIIGNMLSFSKQKPILAEDMDLNEMVRSFFSTPDVLPGNVALELKLFEIPMISADSEKLRQVLNNLVSNAFQSMPEGGTLTVSTKVNKAKKMEISIKDTGQGMNDEVMSRIFEPLFSTRTTGFGLGLAIVKTLVADHGGEIKVKSKVGEGSEFTVVLPIGRDA